MYLGIDLGTSSVKVVVIDNNDELLAQASSPLQVSRPQPLWSEQQAEDWWTATDDAMSAIKATHPELLAKVNAIGLSGQMHGATLLDSEANVLRPAILWNDGRSFQECADIEAMQPESRRITGNIAMPGFTAPKVLWVKKHEPEIYKQIATVLLPKDYLGFRLTGEFASDMSDSAGTLWLDVANRCWSNEMLATCGLTQAHMPKLYEGSESIGVLLPELAKRWGMKCVPVAAGAGDNAAGAAGVGVVEPGNAFISLGTSGVYFVANETYLPNPDEAVHTFCHCLPNTWHQMSVILSAASCLSWVTKLVGAKDEASLLAEVAKLDLSQPGDVIFLPYLSGERTPHNDPNAKGVFFGMTHETGAAELARAVLEGVAYAFADGQQVLLNAGAQIEQVTVIGGGAKSELWGTILASVLKRPLIYRDGGGVGPAFGAARLARLAFAQEDISVVCKQGRVINKIEPEVSMHYYQSEWQKYRRLYQALKSEF